MMITKNTVVGISLTGLITFVGLIYASSVKINDVVTQVYDNTTELAGVVKSLELSRIDRQIAGAESEIRELDRYLLSTGDNPPPLLVTQRASLVAEVIRLRIIRACIASGESVCE